MRMRLVDHRLIAKPRTGGNVDIGGRVDARAVISIAAPSLLWCQANGMGG